MDEILNGKKRNIANENICPSKWLETEINHALEETNVTMNAPKKFNSEEYNIDDLFDDQKEVLLVILKTLHDFMTLQDLKDFKPLRITINGQGGSGKSVVINALVTALRKMFGYNDVVQVTAPTGAAAFNVNGTTLHHLFGITTREECKANNMPNHIREKLIQKFKALLCLIIDERSLINSKVLGTAETKASETMHGGSYHQNDSWGGLPVVALVGDDYQLPTIGSGCLNALQHTFGSKMTYAGCKAMLECAEFVMQLGTSKRLTGEQRKTRELLNRLRVGNDVQEEDVKKLLTLHLANMKRPHGEVFVKEIEDKAMYLFFKNDKRIAHNMEQLCRRCSKTQPVAILKTQTFGRNKGKAVRAHYELDIPSASLFCEGSNVMMQGKNFYPQWGLHNGACGKVQEIIFAKDKNPNHGDLPLHTVVDFPLYCGPVWDKDNPTVSEKCTTCVLTKQ